MADTPKAVSSTRFDSDAVIAREETYIATRRIQAGVQRKDPEQAAALALSGGGIRSATFSLGVLQALAGKDLLKQFDYLSTVSGGGYLGGSLQWWWSGKAVNPGVKNPPMFGLGPTNFPYGVDAPYAEGPRQDSPAQLALLRYLREHGNYLSPGGGITLGAGIGAVLRGIGIHLALLMVFLVTAIVTLEGLAWWVLRNNPLLERIYVAVARVLEGGLKQGFGVEIFFPLSLSIYLLCWVLLAAVFIYAMARAIFYAAALSVPWFRDSHARYAFGRYVDETAGGVLKFEGALLILASLPFVNTALNLAAANNYLTISSIISGVGAVSGIVSGITLFKNGAAATESRAGWLFPLASAATLYAILWAAFSIVRFAFPDYSVARDAYSVVGVLALIALMFAQFVNVNYIALHRFYRDRLMEAFLPDWVLARDRLTRGVQGANDFEMRALAQPIGGAPLPLVNCMLVLVDSDNLTWKQRGGDNFVISPLHAGSTATGWRPTAEFAGGDVTLATAVATSGAAANPNAVGVTRDRLVALLMSILNLRLGYWVPNPGDRRQSRLPNFMRTALSQVGAPLSRGYHEDAKLVHLSDGGHFENLALYELLRRKAGLIVLCDGAADPQFAFADFQTLGRRAAMDFGCSITFPADAGLSQFLRTKALAWPQGLLQAVAGWAEGTIHYADGSEGTLIYVKATLTEGLPPEVLGYANEKANQDFPHQTTADQWFDEEQFEAYRQLGHHLGTQMIADAKLKKKLAAL